MSSCYIYMQSKYPNWNWCSVIKTHSVGKLTVVFILFVFSIYTRHLYLRAVFLWEKKIPCSVVVHKRRAASLVRPSDQKAKQRPVNCRRAYKWVLLGPGEPWAPKKVISVKWQQMSVNITQHAYSRQNLSAKCWEKYNNCWEITRQIVCCVIFTDIIFFRVEWSSLFCPLLYTTTWSLFYCLFFLPLVHSL